METKFSNERISTKIKILLVLLTIVCTFPGCTNDDNDIKSADIVGTWVSSVDYTVHGKDKTNWLYASFYADGTGELENETQTGTTYGEFYYTIKGNKVHCEGARASTEGDGAEIFEWNLEYSANTLVPLDRYTNYPALTRATHYIPDDDIPGDDNVDDNPSDPSSGTNTNQSQNEANKQILCNQYAWEYSKVEFDSSHRRSGQTDALLYFKSNGSILYQEKYMSSTKAGWMGYPSSFVSAKGTYSVNGDQIICRFTDVQTEEEYGGVAGWLTGRSWKHGESRNMSFDFSVNNTYSITIWMYGEKREFKP